MSRVSFSFEADSATLVITERAKGVETIVVQSDGRMTTEFYKCRKRKVRKLFKEYVGGAVYGGWKDPKVRY